jgi:hypothetical protein
MIKLESNEIYNDSSNNDNKKKSKKKNLNIKNIKKNLLETINIDNSDIDNSDNNFDNNSDNNSDNLDNKNIGYPKTSDPNIQSKIYAKREFYYYKLPERPDLTNYKKISEYRKNICEPNGELLEHQSMLSNFINPDTPYKGLLIFHGTGTGKTCVGIAVAEKFKQQVQRYGTHIYILVPGPLLRENWRSSFIQCTGDTYLRSQKNLLFLNDEEKEKLKKQAILNAQQYYKIMSYKSFYRKVLGEKIVEKKMVDGKIRSIYKKTDEGEFERDIGMDILQNLNNSLIIVDEAHNLTGNTYGEALMKIIKNSTNLKILLLTATPMKNLGDDIISLLNFLRPIDSQIQRDLIFTIAKNHTMELKPGGLEYLKNMASGYISHLRGADPMTFAEKIDIGIKPKGLLFTKISQCYMGSFQLEAYNEAIKLSIEEADALDRKSEAVANFVFPGLDSSKKKLIGLYGRDGLNQLKNQLKNHHDKINTLIATDILGLKKYDEELININDNTKNITGNILKIENLKYFSTKFYQAYIDMDSNLFVGGPNSNTESRTGFIYSNLVKTGIEIFQEILNINGFLYYDVNPNNYQIKDNTKCYYCGKIYKDHNKDDNSDKKSNSDKLIKSHKFSPATFIVVTGQSSEEGVENMPEESKKIVTTVFSDLSNKNGKNIKIVLGSKVMNEGISLHNVATVQVLDVYFNFGRIDQVIGRAIRWCSHYNLMTETDPYPKVKVFKYAVSLEINKSKIKLLSTEEELYYKAEQKYLLVKKIERGLKEVAIDCALNQQGNMFKEEENFYNKCIKPNNNFLDIIISDNKTNKEPNICPSKCDFTDCLYKCNDLILKSKYYDPNRNLYKTLKKVQLDYSTFTINLARTEIDYAKRKIKELYMIGYVYNLKTITDYVANSYNKVKKELFDDFFVQKALDEVIPITENDFNNFKDILYDKTYRAGYLIYLDSYYIFQPFDENENAPMYYRTSYQYDYNSKLSLYNYLVNEKYDIDTNIGSELEIGLDHIREYDFIDVMDYYDNRKEYDIVGIIDKETNSKKSKKHGDIKDIFKIREKRDKILEKKRGTGIPSLKGAVCATSKEKKYLEMLAKNIGINKLSKEMTRDNICGMIKNKLIELEKYSKGKNKMTYIMIPSNHPTFKFPLNIEDRIEFIKLNINKILAKNIKFVEKINSKTNSIELNFKLLSKPVIEDINKLEKLGLESKDKLKWIIIVD